MKFRVTRASESDKSVCPCEGAVFVEGRDTLLENAEDGGYWIKEFDSLYDLMSFTCSEGRVIVDVGAYGDAEMVIYDWYIE